MKYFNDFINEKHSLLWKHEQLQVCLSHVQISYSMEFQEFTFALKKNTLHIILDTGAYYSYSELYQYEILLNY